MFENLLRASMKMCRWEEKERMRVHWLLKKFLNIQCGLKDLPKAATVRLTSTDPQC